MQATGLDHRTRELAGLRRTTTANGIMRGTGKDSVAVWNTITTGITTGLATIMTTTTTTIMIRVGTSGSADSKTLYPNIFGNATHSSGESDAYSSFLLWLYAAASLP